MSGNGPWPYAQWVAHRGAGKLAPENTLAAFRLGAQYGYRMFECDVKLSSDNVPFLMHDATLTRTTDAHSRWGDQASPTGGDHTWAQLSHLDAGSWHSRTYAGETLPTLDGIAHFIRQNRFHLNIEIKPTPGTELHTGEVVAAHAERLWTGVDVPPLVTSFDPPALEGARNSAAQLPRGLLLDDLWDGWLECATGLGCQAIVCNYRLWNAETVARVRSAGLRMLSYTVNEASAADQLLALGTHGIITDRVDLFSPV